MTFLGCGLGRLLLALGGLRAALKGNPPIGIGFLCGASPLVTKACGPLGTGMLPLVFAKLVMPFAADSAVRCCPTGPLDSRTERSC